MQFIRPLKQVRIAGWLSGLILFLIWLGPAFAPGVTAASASTADSRTAFQTILEEARRESQKDPRFEIWFATENQTLKEWERAFNTRFGLNFRFESMDLPSTAAATRAIAESKAGREVGSVLRTSLEVLSRVITEKAVAKIDWMGIFGQAFPGIREATDLFVPDLSGYGLHFRDSYYPITFNTQLVKKEQVPRQWEHLLDPKWKGKIAVEGRGYPFNFLIFHPDWNEKRVMKLVHDLANLGPLVVIPSRGKEVLRGEVALQLGGGGETLVERSTGAPIDYLLADPIPLSPVALLVPARSKHPNAALLFVAWATTEGMDIFERYEFSNRVTNPNSQLMKRILAEKTPAGAQIAYPRTIDMLERSEVLRKEIGKFWATRKK
jgi:iron(III) transport system substrate-binding protein